MNILMHFNALAPENNEALAKIINRKSNGIYIAQTPSNLDLILFGEAKIGNFVYYNLHNNQIIRIAPIVNFVDVPV